MSKPIKYRGLDSRKKRGAQRLTTHRPAPEIVKYSSGPANRATHLLRASAITCCLTCSQHESRR